MKFHHLLLPIMLFTLLVALLVRCTDPAIAGGGLDTESRGGKLTGKVIESSGNSAGHAELQLISSDYSPINSTTIYRTNATEEGFYTFNGIDSGTYNLQAVNPLTGTRLLHTNVEITLLNDTDTIETLMLQQPGSIHIGVVSTIDSNCIAYIPGTNISQLIHSFTDTIRFDSLPPGRLPPILYSNIKNKSEGILTDSLELLPSETIHLLAYHLWSHSMNIALDAEKLGSFQPLTTSFPAYLELNQKVINFSEAAPGGRDIRFTNKFNRPIPFEIELWDTLGLKAAIWIRIDSLSIISPPNYVTMFWGNAAASTASSGSSVFDTSHGYRGVYHITEEKIGVRNRNLYIDASEMKNNADDYIRDETQTDWIGYAKHFDKKEKDFILIDPLKGCNVGSGPFTISFWINSDSEQATSLFNWYFYNADTLSFGAKSDSGNTLSFYSNSTLLLKSKTYTPGVWNHVLITRSTSQILTLYLNGKKQSSVPFAESLGGTSDGMFIIAADKNVLTKATDSLSTPFNGYMDEFRIESIERQQEYIQNSYLTQSNKKLFLFSRPD